MTKEGYSIFSHAQNGDITIEESTPITAKRVRSPRGWAVEAGLGLGPKFNKPAQTSTVPKPRFDVTKATIDRMAAMVDNMRHVRSVLEGEIKAWMRSQGADPNEGWKLVLPMTRQYDLGELTTLKFVIFSRYIEKPVLVKKDSRG